VKAEFMQLIGSDEDPVWLICRVSDEICKAVSCSAKDSQEADGPSVGAMRLS